MKRHAGPVVFGGALLAAGIFLFLMLPGCAGGWTDYDENGKRDFLLGFKAASVVAAGGAAGKWFINAFGDPAVLLSALGIGTGGVGLAVVQGVRLVRSWANAKAQAASATTAKVVGDSAYDEGRQRAHLSRDRTDAAYLEGLAHAGPRAVVPVAPVANAAVGGQS